MPAIKCKHGIYGGPDLCAVCKDWPSFERMKNKYPDLSHGQFMLMTPAQRIEAMKPGVEELPQ